MSAPPTTVELRAAFRPELPRCSHCANDRDSLDVSAQVGTADKVSRLTVLNDADSYVRCRFGVAILSRKKPDIE